MNNVLPLSIAIDPSAEFSILYWRGLEVTQIREFSFIQNKRGIIKCKVHFFKEVNPSTFWDMQSSGIEVIKD